MKLLLPWTLLDIVVLGQVLLVLSACGGEAEAGAVAESAPEVLARKQGQTGDYVLSGNVADEGKPFSFSETVAVECSADCKN